MVLSYSGYTDAYEKRFISVSKVVRTSFTELLQICVNQILKNTRIYHAVDEDIE